jgi:predicted GNAT superfamily acetyltransferase
MPVTYRDLTTLDDYASVVELERAIWGPGYDEVVPVPILAVSVLRGGILMGAFDGRRMVGFVYSLPGIKHGKPTQWSHMLGVVDEFRNAGMGHRLKALQRDRALAMGLDLIEWTFDPMQALNAHLNFAKLGVVVDEYEANVYGESNSPLHRGNPTDRFVAEWRIRDPEVGRRLADAKPAPSPRVADLARAARVNRIDEGGACADVDLGARAGALIVDIPAGFTDMLARTPDLALAWRMATREIFTTYFGLGYRAVDFLLDRDRRKGAYVLARG